MRQRESLLHHAHHAAASSQERHYRHRRTSAHPRSQLLGPLVHRSPEPRSHRRGRLRPVFQQQLLQRAWTTQRATAGVQGPYLQSTKPLLLTGYDR